MVFGLSFQLSLNSCIAVFHDKIRSDALVSNRTRSFVSSGCNARNIHTKPVLLSWMLSLNYFSWLATSCILLESCFLIIIHPCPPCLFNLRCFKRHGDNERFIYVHKIISCVWKAVLSNSSCSNFSYASVVISHMSCFGGPYLLCHIQLSWSAELCAILFTCVFQSLLFVEIMAVLLLINWCYANLMFSTLV